MVGTLVQKNKLCIDLCCGLKGFSSSFLKNGWEVVTVDIEEKFNPSICMDIRELDYEYLREHTKLKSFDKYDLVVVLASPPCERFSIAPVAWPLPGIRNSLDIVGSILELIIKIKPKYWCLENPATGYLRWFIGKPTLRIRLNALSYGTVKPTALWGNIHVPFGLIPDSPKKNKRKNAWAYGPRSPAKRGKLPYGLSDVLRKSVEQKDRSKK